MPRTFRIILIALVIMGSLGRPAIAESIDDAISSYKGGDYQKALSLFRPSADRGNTTAQTYLGDMYFYGQGVPQSYSDALSWYRLAAAQNAAAAQNSLGFMYQIGEGIPKNTGEAIKWYTKAADQGYSLAQNNLGILYSSGQEIPLDYVQAYKWFNLVSSRDADSDKRSRAAQVRDVIAALMTPGQIAEAQWLAREWKPVPSAHAP